MGSWGEGEGREGHGEREREHICMWECMYVCIYVYIAEAARNLYCEEYLRLITVCYVSPAQFIAHVRT